MVGPRKWTRWQYSELLSFCSPWAEYVQFVYQGDLDFDHSALTLPELLVGNEEDREPRRTRRWPGTRILGGKATVWRVRFLPAVVRWLKEEGPLPYGWISPGWPEDISIIRHDGSLMFGSISHERRSWVKFTENEMKGIGDYSALCACLGRSVDSRE